MAEGAAPLDGIISGYLQAQQLQRQGVLDAAQRAIQAHQMDIDDQTQQNSADKNQNTLDIASQKNATEQDKLKNRIDLQNIKWDALKIRDHGQRAQFLLKNGVAVGDVPGIMDDLDGHDAAIGAAIDHGNGQQPLPNTAGPGQDAPAAPALPSASDPSLLPANSDLSALFGGQNAPQSGPTVESAAAAVLPPASDPNAGANQNAGLPQTGTNQGGQPQGAAPTGQTPAGQIQGGYGVLPGVQAGMDNKAANTQLLGARGQQAQANARKLDAQAETLDATRAVTVGHIQSLTDYNTFRQKFGEEQEANRVARAKANDAARNAYNASLLAIKRAAQATAQQNADTNSRNADTHAYAAQTGRQALAQRAESNPGVLKQMGVLSGLKAQAVRQQTTLGGQIQKMNADRAAMNAYLDPNAIVPNQATDPRGYQQFMLMKSIAPSRVADINAALPSLQDEYNSAQQQINQYRDLLNAHTQVLSPTGASQGPAGKAAGNPSASAAEGVPPAVARAQQFIGRPYQYGGDGTNGQSVDCSGLVHQAYPGLPRVAHEQHAATLPIARNALQPGDLVFRDGANANTAHVGIYEGNGQIIAAPHTGTQVQRQSLSSAGWSGANVDYRRVPSALRETAPAVGRPGLTANASAPVPAPRAARPGAVQPNSDGLVPVPGGGWASPQSAAALAARNNRPASAAPSGRPQTTAAPRPAGGPVNLNSMSTGDLLRRLAQKAK